jgi:HSF-type DNA-binding
VNRFASSSGPLNSIVFVFCSWFNHSKLSSFQRQMNLYGFKRVTSGKSKSQMAPSARKEKVSMTLILRLRSAGRDAKAYYHELFLRDMPCLAGRIPRLALKGNGPRGPAKDMKHPDFYTMKFLPASRNDASIRCKNEEELPDAARRKTMRLTASDGCAFVAVASPQPGNANLAHAGAGTTIPDLQEIHPASHRSVMEHPFMSGLHPVPPSCVPMAPTRAHRLATVRALARRNLEVAAGLDAAHWNAFTQLKLQHLMEAQRQREILIALRFGAI